MKIPVTTVDLGTIGYDGYWVKMPRSIREGFLHDFTKMTKAVPEDGEDAEAEATRSANIKILELVTEWNIDDEDGKMLPVMRLCKTHKEKVSVLAELPVDVIVHLAQQVAGNVQVPEATKDF